MMKRLAHPARNAGISLAVALAAMTPPLQAETLTVCAEGGCDYATIQAAIDAAAPGDVIEVSGETYLLDETIDTLGKSITLRGSTDPKTGAPRTVLDGQGARGVMRCTSGEGADTVIQSLLIRNGGQDWNGGVLISQSAPTFINCIFTEHTGEYSAAVEIRYADPTFTGCTFSDNSGGGIFNIGSSSTITNCTFMNNTSPNFMGGAMINAGGDPTVDGCTFSNNSSSLGGGALHNQNGGSLVVMNSTFSNNRTDKRGGGLENFYSASATVINCTFTDNSADIGGGIYSDETSTLLIETSVLCGNQGGQILGSFTASDDNCALNLCSDPGADGAPGCTEPDDMELQVPGEYDTIAEAIDAAEEGAVITIAPGTYQPAGTLDTLGKALTIRGTVDADGTPTTILDGRGTINLITCGSGEGTDTVLENLVLRNGYNSVGGGAASIDQSSPTFTNCTFTNNTASMGGAIRLSESIGVVVQQCTFTGNTSESLGGCLSGEYSSVDISQCTFTDNSAVHTGGALYMIETTTMVEDCLFRENSAGRAGAIYHRNGPFTLAGSSFRNNTAREEAGGAVHVHSDLSDFEDCSFTNNHAATSGGGLQISGSTWNYTDFIRCEFTDNGAGTSGGAVYNQRSKLNLVECTLRNNAAGETGAGIYHVMYGNSELVLESTAVCDNTPDQVEGSYTDAGDSCVGPDCRECGLPAECPADITGDGEVAGADLTLLLTDWGCNGTDCTADLDGNGTVDGADLAIILSNWGGCSN